MDKLRKFIGKYAEGIGASKITRAKLMALAGRLIREDPLDRIKFEASFKVKGSRMTNYARLLNMDGNSYSCKSPLIFLERLQLYRAIMLDRTKNPFLEETIKALLSVVRTPMDLYFGADIDGSDFIFAFWIIFGGVKRTGEMNFWDYDFEQITRDALKAAGFKPPVFLKKNILNLGFDITAKNIFYKLYYLLSGPGSDLPQFKVTLTQIKGAFTRFKYFSYFSKMYDRRGDCVKEKLFIEFLEDIFPQNPKINELLEKVLKIGKSSFDPDRLFNVCKHAEARISLVSFQTDGTITFYLRPD